MSRHSVRVRDDEPARHEASLLATGHPDEVMHKVDTWVKRYEGRVLERPTLTLGAKLGSRFAFRMWGTRTNRLPIRVDLDIRPGDTASCSVTAKFSSDEGWYLTRTSGMFRVYAKKFEALAKDLDEHLNGPGLASLT